MIAMHKNYWKRKRCQLKNKLQYEVVFCYLVFISFIAFSLDRVKTDFFVILFKSSQIFTGLGKFAFFHTFSHVPVDKSTFGIHQVKLMVKTCPGLSNGSGVGQHANSTLDFSQVTARNNGWRLVIDTDLETSGTPIDKLDGTLGLDGSNGSIDILGDNIATVKHAAGHVLSMAWVTLDHLVARFKTSIGDFGNRQLLMVSLLGRDDG